MAYMNKMTSLLNKIENRLGVELLNLPEKINKTTWGDKVIIDDTLVTFSRYMQRSMEISIGDCPIDADGWHHIDEDKLGGVEILGVQDLDWSSYNSYAGAFPNDLGYIDAFTTASYLTVEQVGEYQMAKDISSLFSNGIFVDFKAPNMFRLTNTLNTAVSKMDRCKIKILIKHDDSLVTIPPTMMETFEELAISDVAGFLYRNLKYYDGKESVFSNIDLKLDELQDKMQRRDDIIDQLKNASVSCSNDACPICVTF